MKIEVNPLGRLINEYLMKMALPLAGWFIIEYLVSCGSVRNTLLSLLVLPMKCVVPVALWWMLRQLRRRYLFDAIPGFSAWTFGVQLMFFAGLIEAMFIYLFNEFLVPGNLMAVQQGLIGQYENAYTTLKEMGMYANYLPTLEQMIAALKEAPVGTAIESAITALSNDIFIGMILMIPIALIVRKKPQSQNQ